ncbi:hypothetical protein [Plantactinospora sp. GCM10030261]
MSMINRIRSHRNATRRARAINRALRSTSSPAVADEIMAAAMRQFR